MPVCCPAETPAIINRFYLVGFKDNNFINIFPTNNFIIIIFKLPPRIFIPFSFLYCFFYIRIIFSHAFRIFFKTINDNPIIALLFQFFGINCSFINISNIFGIFYIQIDWINLIFITLIVKIRVYIICIGISLSYIIFRRKIKTFTEKAIVTISYPIFIKNLYSFVRAAMIHHQRPAVFINNQTVAKPFIKSAHPLLGAGNPLPRAVAHGLFFTINLNIVFRITVDKINQIVYTYVITAGNRGFIRGEIAKGIYGGIFSAHFHVISR